MKKYISKKLVFIAENILNPTTYKYLLNEEVLKTATGKNGYGLYNFASFEPNGNVVIDEITASLETNNSQVGKQIQPISSIGFYTNTSKNLGFIKSLPETKLSEVQFSFNGIPKTSYSQLANTEYETSDRSKTPENIIRFDADLNHDLLYLPNPVKGSSSIVDTIRLLYKFSFQDYFQGTPNLKIPSSVKSVMIFPMASLPIPPALFRTSTGTIAIGIQINIGYTEL